MTVWNGFELKHDNTAKLSAFWHSKAEIKAQCESMTAMFINSICIHQKYHCGFNFPLTAIFFIFGWETSAINEAGVKLLKEEIKCWCTRNIFFFVTFVRLNSYFFVYRYVLVQSLVYIFIHFLHCTCMQDFWPYQWNYIWRFIGLKSYNQ